METVDRELFIGHLENVYNQANTHLLEQGRKRDQVILFVLVVLSFYLTTKSTLVQAFGARQYTWISLGIVLLMVIATIELADLRGWHQQYIDSIYVINYMLGHLDEYATTAAMVAKMRELSTRQEAAVNKPFYRMFFGSTDNDIFSFMLIFTIVVALIPFHGFIQSPNMLSWVLFSLAGLVYFLKMELFLKKKLAHGERYLTWIVDFDYRSSGK